ncbi:type II secretion system F family protein [Rhodococcus sp. NPDC058521]|uniref:type II secretion system F family protein n=1 Tax=Rhodococcus sp. NPDC058521 TaxID=3346536 RepID=UPI003654A1BE
MTAPALLLGAAAVVVAPQHMSRRRLGDLVSVSETPRFLVKPYVPILVIFAVAVWWFGGLPALMAGAVVAATAYKRHSARRADAIREAELGVVLCGLEVLIAELEVGAHPADACAMAAEDCDGPVAGAFRVASARAQLGGSAAEGFVDRGSSVDAELTRIGSVWSIAETRGLALAELLGAVRTDLLGRSRFRKRTESSLAGARATASVLAGLPLLGVGLGHLMGASPLRILLGGGIGGVMLVVGATLLCVGLLWTDRITAAATR